MAYVATVIFAIGICWFWPTMIGVAAQRVPKSGALGMSIIGGRSEEHTSELQSLMRTSYAVFCLKKKITRTHQLVNSNNNCAHRLPTHTKQPTIQSHLSV